MRERVTTSVFLGARISLSYESFRDDHGRMTLSYLWLAIRRPRLIGTQGRRHYYDLTLRTDVLTRGKPVYTQEDPLTGNLTDAQAEVARKKHFGAEARLPLAPGKYTILPR